MIQRVPGFTNAMMVDHCEALLRVVEKKVVDKKGRSTLKHKTPSDIVDNIRKSVEYYRGLLDCDFEFRPYQLEIKEKALHIINGYGFVYLAMEVRTGKTLTSLGICKDMMARNVLFLTKKKGVDGISADAAKLGMSDNVVVVNYESMHHEVDSRRWDIVILDEAHSLGAFPKPSGRAIDVKDLISKHKPHVILLSGTPTPESFSQMYHQVYGIPGNPFAGYKNFYRFADDHVKVKTKMINGRPSNDYSNGLPSILKAMEPYMISFTQKQAGFVNNIEEIFLSVRMKDSTYDMVRRLKRDLVIEGKTETILADTPAKLMQKVHQLQSGTIKFESGNSMVIDDSKAKFIKEYFSGAKIAIFYKFVEELNALKSVFGDDLTTELSVFEDTPKSIALQIVSGSEAISLKDAHYIVYYNVDFSAKNYWQSRDRMTTSTRRESKIFWVFSEPVDGPTIERDVYDAISDKKDYTLKHFKNAL